jgi:hypothetical protein
MESTQTKLYALLRDKKDNKEYDVYLRIHEEKVNLTIYQLQRMASLIFNEK